MKDIETHKKTYYENGKLVSEMYIVYKGEVIGCYKCDVNNNASTHFIDNIESCLKTYCSQ